MKILVLEASTTAAKAMLYDSSDNSYEVKAETYKNTNDDVTIHDAENVYQQMLAVGRALAEGKDIDIIALSGTWHSLVLCNKDMVPQTPVYLWSYTGAAGVCKELRKDKEYVKNFYKKTGCMVNAIYPFFKLLHLQRQGYDLKDYYILGQGTYNNYRMTGQRVITHCLASGTGLLNIQTKEIDKELLAALGIKEEQLSMLVDYNQTFPLNEEAAAALGVKPGIPVVPTNSDGGLNQVGSGAMEEGVMTFSVGTSGAIRLTTMQPVMPEEPSTWCYMSPKYWLSGAATNGCCNCIDWFKMRMFGPNVSYDEIEKGVRDKETTPVFLPFIFGERCPGWNDERLGGFEDIRPHHTKYDLYRAVQEGVLFNLYHCYTILTKVNGVPNKIKLSGGILNSQEWTQMCADIFQAEMEIDNSKHASLLGGAVLAMEILGVIKDVKDFNFGQSKVIRPNPDMAKLYQEKFERYLKYYYMS